MDGQKEDLDEFKDVDIADNEQIEQPQAEAPAQTEESIGLGDVQINLEQHVESNNQGIGNEVEEKKAAGVIETKQEEKKEGGRLERCVHYLSMKFLQPYFDVNTTQIKQRLIASIYPMKFKGFYEEYSQKPDLYGPMWIYSTLVCFLFIAGNISRYSKTESEKEFTYNFKFVPVAFFIIFGVGLGLPLLMKLALRVKGNSVQEATPAATAIGIYGYSFTSFLVPVLVCAIPVEWLQWIIICYSALSSTLFLIAGYWQELAHNLEGKFRWMAIAFLCAVQLTLLIVFKLYFFASVGKGHDDKGTDIKGITYGDKDEPTEPKTTP